MTCRSDKYKDEYKVIKAFQAKAIRRELCDESATDFIFFLGSIGGCQALLMLCKKALPVTAPRL